MNRRAFVTLTVAGTCVCCATCAVADAPASQPAKKPPASQPAKPVGSLDAGAIDQYAQDGVYDAFRQSNKVLIFRQQNRLYAASARCTHKGCILKANGATALKCPCHGSEFDINGRPTDGRPNAALGRYEITLKDEKIVVNTTKLFPEREWENPKTFIELKTELKTT